MLPQLVRLRLRLGQFSLRAAGCGGFTLILDITLLDALVRHTKSCLGSVLFEHLLIILLLLQTHAVVGLRLLLVWLKWQRLVLTEGSGEFDVFFLEHMVE